MSDNFDRQYRMKAGVKGQTGFELGKTVGSNSMPIHINFSLEKSGTSSNNTGTITLSNITKEHKAILEKKDCMIELKAGYGNNLPLIFAGTVSTVTSEMSGQDESVKIEAVDGLVAIRDTYISKSYDSGTNGKTIIDYIGKQMGCSVVYSREAKQKLTDKKFNGGFSAAGAAKEALNKICKTCGLTWSIQNGVLQIVVNGQPISYRVYVISPKTGLISIPKKVTISSSTESSQAIEGWEITYMMNGAIGVDDYIKLESKYASGFFKVYKVKITGDNFGNDWKCTATVREVVV